MIIHRNPENLRLRIALTINITVVFNGLSGVRQIRPLWENVILAEIVIPPFCAKGADHFDIIKRINDEAPRSLYMGFLVDTTELFQYSANISAVNERFQPDLYTGNYTPELFADYKAQLEAAGVHDYLNGVQAQLDAWLAAQ